MVCLCGLGTLIDANSTPARVGILTGVTISTIMIYQSNKASMPRVAFFTFQDIYFWVCFCFVYTAFIEYAFLSTRIQKDYPTKKSKNSKSKKATLENSQKKKAEGIDSSFRKQYFSCFILFNLCFWFYLFWVTFDP